jgi:hypothetical protein
MYDNIILDTHQTSSYAIFKIPGFFKLSSFLMIILYFTRVSHWCNNRVKRVKQLLKNIRKKRMKKSF